VGHCDIVSKTQIKRLFKTRIRVLKCRKQLAVQVAVGVQTTAWIARVSPGSIGESAARLLDEKGPRRVVSEVGALDQERFDLAPNELDQRERTPRRTKGALRQPGSGRIAQRFESSIGQPRSTADFEAPRISLARPRRLERATASGRPPTAA
jgi:hypothetical protein